MRKNVVTRNQLYIQNCIVEITRVLKSSEKENVPKPHTWTGGRRGGRDEVASTYNQSQPHGKEYKYLDTNRPLKIQLQSLLAHGQTYNKPTNVETQIR